MIWERTESENVLRCGEGSIVKWPWQKVSQCYCLWHGDNFIGRYASSRIAKEEAIAARSQQDHSNNAG